MTDAEALQLLQTCTCFRVEVCDLLPCECAETIGRLRGALDKRALAKRLAPTYVKDDLATGGITRQGLARLCDEAIDPSGELLGYIREEAFQLRPNKEAELEPHAYVPSIIHMGDCAVCGHLQGAAIHSPFRRKDIAPDE